MGSRGWTWALILAVAFAPVPPGRGDDQTDRAIEALRDDRSFKVRAQAALVLGQRRSADAVPALCHSLAEDDAPAVRMAAAAALGKIGDPSAMEALGNARRSDPDREVRDAAARALAELRRDRRSRAVSLEEIQGELRGGDREAFAEALVRHLSRHGFDVVARGEPVAYRIKPSVLSLDVTEAGGRVLIAVKASAVAVDGRGRMAAMTEGSARLRATGGSGGQLSARALDAAAKELSEDLAARLK